MIKIKRLSNNSFLEFDNYEKYKILENDIEETNNFFRYVDLINQLAYREGFTFYINNYYRSIKIDPIPRLLDSSLFEKISRGLKSRAEAINKFLYEYYYQRDKLMVPDVLVESSPYFRPEMIGFYPPKGIYVYILGEDIVNVKGFPYILEDNVRIPSGLSYAIKSTELTNRILGEKYSIKSTEGDGLEKLKRTLEKASDTKDPVIVILTDGTLNSAYFEHKYFSDKLNLILAEPSDLKIKNNEVLVETTEGEIHVDVIYRRIEDLDVLTPGLMNAYLRGEVNIVNAPGTGIADDKLTFCFMPQIMEALGFKEEIRQPFSFPIGTTKEDIEKKIESMVIKRREGYGGSGTFVLHDMSEEEKIKVLNEVRKTPEEFMAQELLDFDTVVSAINDSFYQTYADLRFFVYLDETSSTILSRVAPIGSRVTNNSSGGLVKPVWIT
ncbi:circularly permuted type 2 ATP-grasp protein [Acidianus sulfidivorans JP7]|uniref:Circularly permuted ATP-grasp type 2 domain-containing protein n=1 Tax=Acidianus sulfidivorans JP7 TaxID=619593 RepID=A0A2U9IQ92_9CREN|nr:circularly permuted type 2 ATP-grasp protein [Acidianus sulfidivorans]AWR98218.1 circularly permuted type 2 ATP-grasp protein [Acidianus sulfidivorans JP7]